MSRWDTLNPPLPPDADEGGTKPRRRSNVAGIVALVAIVAGFFAVTRAGITSPPPPRPDATSSLGALADPGETYDPFEAGETMPSGYRQLLRRDAILPVYDPTFVPDATNDAWEDDTLVIGLAIDGEAKAYPVSFLNRREIVVDSIAGIPVLVTW